jgi:protein-S-isoprenylcysteine O-methyltransferase Ste14
MSRENIQNFRVAAIKSIILSYAMLLLQMVIFFVSAGNIGLLRPWIYFGISCFHYLISTITLYKLNPELLVHRLKLKRKGSKLWDEILMRVSNLTALILIPTIAGLDVGRFHWSSLTIHYVIIGFVLNTISTVLLNWAMITNPHFEPTVRIQRDRDHKVITSGPYKIVRHPGYLAGILFIFSIPFYLGSFFSFIPAGIYFLLMVTRTWLEDNTLQKELTGYIEYTKKTRYRLFPFIW